MSEKKKRSKAQESRQTERQERWDAKLDSDQLRRDKVIRHSFKPKEPISEDNILPKDYPTEKLAFFQPEEPETTKENGDQK